MKIVLLMGGIVATLVLLAIFFITFTLSGHTIYKGSALSFVDYGSQGANQGIPVRLRIPAIGVDAAIEEVGLTLDGAMDVPANPANVAWFDRGPRPGAEGSAVIAGHEGWKNDLPAVFDDLYSLHAGDLIYVDEKSGTTTAFVVRSVRTYVRDEDASEVFIAIDGKAHLNLVTCEGVWNKTRKSYAGRLVVFADAETGNESMMLTGHTLLPLININK